ncbi:transcriptional regulator [Algihabitans sp.]|uniref:transcriptional regulator n=1 Tax=Algihabitans sp. TaxID=2821514 RepID=UPI003BA866F4
MRRILSIGLVVLLVGPGALLRAQTAALELVMFDSAACPFCRQWDEEIGGIYANTPEGRAAPLRRVDLHETPPSDLREIQRGVIYTPTFVLMLGGEEVGRIAGYPGEHFFWPLLANLLDEVGVQTN